MRILFALLSAFIGIILVAGGYRVARFIIPLFGFMAGLSLGGAVIADMANTPFLGTFVGVIVGLLCGLAFAALAYAYYYVAVVVIAGGLGYWLGSGFILLLGFRPGLLSALIGIGVGIVAGTFAVFANAPKYVLIFLTAIAGAVATIGGIMLLFNAIPLDTFSYTTARVAIHNSFFWSLSALALAILGMVLQFGTTSGTYEFDEWALGGKHQLPPTTPRARRAH